MNKNIILLVAAALLCTGCEKLAELAGKAGTERKVAAAEAAAAKATARFAAAKEAAARAEVRKKATAAGLPATAEAQKGAAGLIGLLCSSPKLLEEIESDKDLLDALSGEGGDKQEVRRQFLRMQKRYRARVEKAMLASGATYSDFTQYAAEILPGKATATQKKEFRARIAEKCPRRNPERIEKMADGLLYYCLDAGPTGK